MRTSHFLAAALIAAIGASADSSSSSIVGIFHPVWSVDLPEYGSGASSTAASLVNINAGAATYHVGCVSGAPKTDCNLATSMTFIQGPATASATVVYIASKSDKSQSYDVTVTESYACSLKSSTLSASCTMSVGVTGSKDNAKFTSSSTTSATYSTAPVDQSYFPLTVTGGLESFTAPAATKSPGGAAAATGVAGSVITAAPMLAAAAVAALL